MASNSVNSHKIKRIFNSSEPQCFAINCTNYKNRFSRDKGISFHSFPRKDKSPLRYGQWVAASRRTVEPSKWALLCSAHFTPDCFDRTGQTVRLKQGAVPTLFSLPEPLRKSVGGSNTSRQHATEKAVSPGQPALDDVASASATSGKDHGYSCSQSKRKRKAVHNGKRLNKMTRRSKSAIRHEQRAPKSCAKLVEDLYHSNSISSETRLKLQSYGDVPVEEFTKPVEEYSDLQRDFALTLHLDFPKAYESLREKNIPLPPPGTLRRWMESVDGSPGINKAMLDVLCEKKIQWPEQYTRCCLTIDALSIQKHLHYCSHSNMSIGYVDLGGVQDLPTEANEALVIMMVGLTGSWKAPVAYYLTAGLSAQNQSVLLSQLLSKVHELGFEVKAITLDGQPTDFAVASLLGAKLNITHHATQPFFIYNKKKIFVMFDLCRTLKRLKNTLQAYNTVISPQGPVSWNHMVALHKVRQSARLRLGNKHVEIDEQKLKVSLTVQTFSSSVTKALRILAASGHADFQECLPTADFIERLHHLFDILHSRSPMGKGSKSPTDVHNMAKITDFLQDTRAFLLSLRTSDGQPIVKTKRAVCIAGLVLLIDAATDMMKELLQHQKYILFYKFGQDHVEVFFNAVRRSGGSNYDPTAKDLMRCIRRIMAQCGAIKASDCGNCTAQDVTELIQRGTETYVPPESLQNADNLTVFKTEFVLVHDHFYNPRRLSPVIENAVVYNAGWVVRKIMATVSCCECREALVTDVHALKNTSFADSYHLLQLKWNGGFVVPSAGCVRVLVCTERHIRRAQAGDRVRAKKDLSLMRTEMKVVAEIGNSDCLVCGDHALGTVDGINSHHFSLIRLLVRTYFTLRQVTLHSLRTLV